MPYLFSAAFPRAEAPGTRRTPLYELISLPGSETRPPPVYGQLSHASLPSASLLRPAASLTTAPRALPLPPLAPHRTSERLIILPRPKRQPFSEGCHSRVLRRAVEGLLWKRSRRGSRAVEAVPWKSCYGRRRGKGRRGRKAVEDGAVGERLAAKKLRTCMVGARPKKTRERADGNGQAFAGRAVPWCERRAEAFYCSEGAR